MQEVLMVKLGEVVLKGLNRRKFEDKLFAQIRHRLSSIGSFKYSYAQSTFYIQAEQDEAQGFGETIISAADRALSYIFGIASITRSAVCEKDMDSIKNTLSYLDEGLMCAKTFKVEAKRSDKRFPLNSPAICAEIGAYLLQKYPHLTVDVHAPDITVRIEIREKAAYVHSGSRTGAGGMPAGTSGKAMLLLSGGIDSPVAGYMLARRGAAIAAVHFHSYPYTSERAKEKVLQLASLVARYHGDIKVHIVSFTKIQEEMRKVVPEDLYTVIMRRLMMRIAERLALQEGCDALITGESLAQVASQTMRAITVTDCVCSKPVFRPLIGLDKIQIIDTARKIGTFDKSIEPYEDCCAIFSPKHPDTQPKLKFVEAAEDRLPCEELIQEAVDTAETVTAGYSEKSGIWYR